jgi:hypothetical protein
MTCTVCGKAILYIQKSPKVHGKPCCMSEPCIYLIERQLNWRLSPGEAQRLLLDDVRRLEAA